MKPAGLQQQLENIYHTPGKAEALANVWLATSQEVVETFRQRTLASHKLEIVGGSSVSKWLTPLKQSCRLHPLAVLQLGASNEDDPGGSS